MSPIDPESTLEDSSDPLHETRAGALEDGALGDGAPEHWALRQLQPVAPPRIEGYELHEMIGRGSAGVVFRATQLAVEREVAIKVLHAELSGKPRVVRRMQREARTMARLGHPNVVSAIDMGQAEGRWWFAMEYVDGPSLLDRLRVEGRLSEREALRLFTSVAEALEHLAAHGVVHRDVKPANILLATGGRDTGRGRAVLADLGLAFAETDASLTRQGGGTLGTPHYISPEQARDASVVDVRADIWGFGATLFHALCGRPPFRSSSVAEVLSAVLHGRVPDPRRYAPELSTGMTLVLRKCLAREPEDRYQTPRELLDDLERLRERRAPRVRRAELDPLARAGSRLPAWVVGVGSGLVLGLGVAGLGWWWGRDSAADPAPIEGAVRPADPLAEVLELARIDSGQLAQAFRSVAELRALAPSGLEGWAATRELEQLARAQVTSIAQPLVQEVDAELAAGNYAGAERLVSTEFDRRLFERTGLRRADLGQVLGGVTVGALEQLELRVVGAAERALEQARQSLASRLEQVELREVARLAEQRRYASALAALDAALDSGLAAIGVDPARWRETDLVALRGSQAAELQRLRASLRTGWTSAQRSLQDWLGERTAGLRAALDWTVPEGAGPQALRVELEAERIRRGLELAELTATGAQLLEESLARRQAELRVDLSERAPGLVSAAFELRAELLAPELYRARDPQAALALFEDFARRASPAGLAGAPGLEPALGTELAEARRMSALRTAAIAGVRRAAREERQLELEPLSGVRLRGRIDSGPEPELDGFRFLGQDGITYQLNLQRVQLEDYEQLVEIGLEPAELSALDRALLRLREDRPVGAELAGAAARSEEGAADGAIELQERLWLRVVEARTLSTPSERARAMRLLRRLGTAPEPLLEERDPRAARVALELVLGPLGAQLVEVNFARPVLSARLAALRAAGQ